MVGCRGLRSRKRTEAPSWARESGEAGCTVQIGERCKLRPTCKDPGQEMQNRREVILPYFTLLILGFGLFLAFFFFFKSFWLLLQICYPKAERSWDISATLKAETSGHLTCCPHPRGPRLLGLLEGNQTGACSGLCSMLLRSSGQSGPTSQD